MKLIAIFVEMLDQYNLIHETDWDTLILLDACRHDYFKRYITFAGKLQKCRSRGYHTWPWLRDTFPDFYPWTYFSAHPYVGSKTRGQPWNAPNHFKRVVSIWSFGWNDRLGTVHPNVVGETVKSIPYEKAIMHYVQPHGPWIGKTKWLNPWTLAQYDRYQAMGDWVAVKTKPDPKFFRACYRDNLKLVLKSVEKYLPYFKGKVVITADHGELLGEGGMYLHGAVEKSKAHLPYPKWAVDFLRDVFWFELER